MEYLILYGIFCLTTAIAAIITLLVPVLSNIRAVEPLNQVAQYPVVTGITFFCLSMLFAPVILLAMFIGSMGEKFKDTLVESLLADN